MTIKCCNYGRRIKGCALYVDAPHINNAEDAERAPIPCEPCWKREQAAAQVRGDDAFTDSWDAS